MTQKSRYHKVTIGLNKVRRYPFKAKEITFIMAGQHYMGAVESLMMYMGYNTNKYWVKSRVPCKYKE